MKKKIPNLKMGKIRKQLFQRCGNRNGQIPYEKMFRTTGEDDRVGGP